MAILLQSGDCWEYYSHNTPGAMTLKHKDLTLDEVSDGQTVACGLAAAVLRFAESEGIDCEALCDAAGLVAANLADPEGRLALDRYAALLRAAIRLSGQPAFTVRFASGIDMAEFSVVGLLGHSAQTMVDALEQMNRFGRLLVDVESDGDGRFALEDHGDGLWLVDRRRAPNRFPELTETTFARMTIGTRQFGEGRFVDRIEMTHRDPGYGAEMERLMGAPIRFGAPRNALRVSRDWQQNPIARYPRLAGDMLERQAGEMLKQLDRTRTVGGQLAAWLDGRQGQGLPQLAEAAGALGLSGPQLQRALKREGFSFAVAIDRHRKEQALAALCHSDEPTKAIAWRLGFSEPSALSRAVKRWTGLSPMALRSGGSRAL